MSSTCCALASSSHYKKVYISSRSARDCDATARELNAAGPGTCVALPADMQKLDDVDRLVKELGARESALHVLVNNAGAAWGEALEDYPVRTIGHTSRNGGRDGC